MIKKKKGNNNAPKTFLWMVISRLEIWLSEKGHQQVLQVTVPPLTTPSTLTIDPLRESFCNGDVSTVVVM